MENIQFFFKESKKEKKKNKNKNKKLIREKESSHCVVLKKITNVFWRRNMSQKTGI
jgi:hypothetical protein